MEDGHRVFIQGLQYMVSTTVLMSDPLPLGPVNGSRLNFLLFIMGFSKRNPYIGGLSGVESSE